MPYPRAYWVLLLLVPFVLFGFWDSYFSVLDRVPLAYHVHGVTASLWLLMLILQSWLIHHRHAQLHRLAGQASLALFPLFIVGSLMVLHSMAQRTADAHPFMDVFGAGLGIYDVLAISAFAWLYCAAIRHRGNVQLHARYMLATPLLLLSPVLARVLQRSEIPGLTILGPDDLHLFFWHLHLTNGFALLLALLLYATAPAHGRPFMIVAVVATMQAVVFQWIGPMPWWRGMYEALASVPISLVAAVGLIVCLGLVAWAWRSPIQARVVRSPADEGPIQNPG